MAFVQITLSIDRVGTIISRRREYQMANFSWYDSHDKFLSNINDPNPRLASYEATADS